MSSHFNHFHINILTLSWCLSYPSFLFSLFWIPQFNTLFYLQSMFEDIDPNKKKKKKSLLAMLLFRQTLWNWCSLYCLLARLLIVWFQGEKHFSEMFKRAPKPADEVQCCPLNNYNTLKDIQLYLCWSFLCFMLCLFRKQTQMKNRNYQPAMKTCQKQTQQRYRCGPEHLDSHSHDLFHPHLCLWLFTVHIFQEKTGGLAGFFKKSPKPAPRSVATQVPNTFEFFMYFYAFQS